MATEFYLCYSYGGGTDFEVQSEAYETPEARLEDARKVWAGEYGGFDPDEDNLFWLDIGNGKPLMGAFSSSDFEDVEEGLDTAEPV